MQNNLVFLYAQMINFDKFCFLVDYAQKKHMDFYVSHKHKTMCLFYQILFTDSPCRRVGVK